MEHFYGAKSKQILLKPLEHTDLEILRRWRNDNDISKFFRKMQHISIEQQNRWYRDYLREDGAYFWVIVERNVVIGALSIYNIKDGKAEIGKIMIGDISVRGKGYGYQSIIMAMKIGFEILQLQTIQLNVHEKNKVAYNLYKRVGFKVIGRHDFDMTGCEYEMEINKEIFDANNPTNNIVVYRFDRKSHDMVYE